MTIALLSAGTVMVRLFCVASIVDWSLEGVLVMLPRARLALRPSLVVLMGVIPLSSTTPVTSLKTARAWELLVGIEFGDDADVALETPLPLVLRRLRRYLALKEIVADAL